MTLVADPPSAPPAPLDSLAQPTASPWPDDPHVHAGTAQSVRAQLALATPDRFTAWLMHWGPTQEIGYRRNAASCPLARFAHEDLGLCDVSVDGMDLSFFDPTDGHRLDVRVPDWASAFIREVDHQDCPVITVGLARALLSKVLLAPTRRTQP